MRFPILVAIAAAVLFLTSCSDEQIARVQTTVDATDRQLVRANEALATAEKALASAKQIADQLGSEQAQRVIVQAENAFADVKGARDVAKITSDAAHSALDAAKGAQAAGGSSIAVIGAAATGLVPGILAALVAASKWLQTLRSFRQTVKGLDIAKERLGPEAWSDKVAPALEAAQDEATKRHVDQVQAQAKAA